MRSKSGKFFEVVVTYEKMCEDGLAKKTEEKVTVEAFTVSEAEARALEEYAPQTHGETECLKVNIAPYKEIFFADEGDKFYKAKVNLITLKEASGKEKKTGIWYLTNAASIEGARKNIVEAYKGSVQDYDIASLSETKIIEVYEKK